MEASEINDEALKFLLKELIFTYSQSSGPGGQHVNKVASRVTLKFDVQNSSILTENQKEKIKFSLGNKLSKEGVLIIDSQTERSQYRNKEIAISRFIEQINKALIPPKKRIPTKPTKASDTNRLEKKKRKAETKILRKKPDDI